MRKTLITGALILSMGVANAQSWFDRLGQEFKNHGYGMKGPSGNGIVYQNTVGPYQFSAPLFAKKPDNTFMKFDAAYFIPKNASNDSLSTRVNAYQGQKMFTIDTTTADVQKTYASIDSVLRGLTTGVNDENYVPAVFSLGQNYPNPFNASTNISFTLPSAEPYRLFVSDVLGREVYRYNGAGVPGQNVHPFSASGLPSGTYFYSVDQAGRRATKKMSLTK